jgi:methenyltetrahydromethanopterin cyclohydrolase
MTIENISINTLTQPLVTQLVAEADVLRLTIDYLDNGCRVVDAALGGLEAGRRLVEIALGGLGKAYIDSHLRLQVTAPVLACAASQFPNWTLHYSNKGKALFHGYGCGAAQVLAKKSPILKHLEYKDRAGKAALIVIADKVPPLDLTDQIADTCGVEPDELTLIITPVHSLTGMILLLSQGLAFAIRQSQATWEITDATMIIPLGAAGGKHPIEQAMTHILQFAEVSLWANGDPKTLLKHLKERPSLPDKIDLTTLALLPNKITLFAQGESYFIN